MKLQQLSLALALMASISTAIAQKTTSVFKQALYFQSSATGSNPAGNPYAPYQISISAPNPGTVTPPGLGAQTLLARTDNQDYEIRTLFATKSALTAAYPDGTYTINAAGAFTLPVGGDLFPPATPQIIGGTWQNGCLVLNPAVANTITVSTFSSYGSYPNGSYMDAEVNNVNSTDNVSLQQQIATLVVPGLTQSSTPFTSFVIPANTLKAPGMYEFDLTFGAITTFSATNGLVVGGYENVLQCYIVTQSGTGPSITGVSGTVTAPLGSTAVLTGTASFGNTGSFGQNGNQAFWYFNGQGISPDNVKYLSTGGNGGNVALGINNITNADAGVYTLVVNTGTGRAQASTTLTIGQIPAPTIAKQPSSLTIVPNGTTVLSVSASGTGLTYQWYLNGNPINGATRFRYVFNANTNNAGTYTCKVTNAGGTVTTDPAVVTLATGTNTTTNIGRLGNISVISDIGSGLSLGFVLGGAGTTGTTPVLIRALGPTISGLAGVALPVLPDPLLTLFNAAQVATATNSGWGANQAAVLAADVLTFAFPLSNPASLDAAFVSNLSGLNSVSVTGKSGDAGTALAEVYDANPNYVPTSPRLVNLSCILNIKTAGTLTAGFVLTGNTSRTILIRGLGPALASLGLPGAVMADPRLTLNSTSGASQGVLATNLAWGGDPQINTVTSLVTSFTLSNPQSADSVILVTLPPGLYSASVTSAGNGGGNALLEVYEIP